MGREDELKEIKEKLENSKQLLLLNGIGGIGKSTLAIEYINQYKNEYEHIAFVEFSGDIKDSFLSAFKNSFVLKNETPDERFKELLEELTNIKGKNLLIVDDIKTQDDFNAIKNLSSNFELLITSRVEFNTIHKYMVETLSEEKAKELFLEYYDTDEDIDKLLEYLDYHTLFIKLTAETLANTRTMGIKDLESKFENGDFKGVTNKLEKKSFNIYLSELFNLNKLNESEILLLKRLSLFPSIEIEFDKLKDFLSVDDVEEFDTNLTDLYTAGWLIKNGDSFKLHQIIKEFLLSSHHISYEECEDIVQRFIDIFNVKADENPVERFEFIPFGTSIVNNLNEKNEEIAILINNLSKIYKDKGDLEKALEYQKKSLEFMEEVPVNNYLDLVTSYNNISTIYKDMGRLEKALEYQKKSLKIKEEILVAKDESLATGYNNISMIYRDVGELEKALKYQIKALELTIELLGNKNLSLAINYNNISLIYKSMGELKKALEYQKKALELREEFLEDKHISIAESYLNFASIYFSNSDIKNAKIYIDKSVDNFSESFPNGHPHLDIALGWQKVIYSK